MALITVNETCISCGACAEVCPVDTIKIVDKKPQAVSSFCIACGHCVAVCPVNAIDNEKNPLSAQKQIPDNITFNEQTVYYLLRSRRSIRNFKDQVIPQDIIEQLIQIGTFAPTGSNSQGVSYMVVSGQDNIQKLADYTADWMEIESQKGGLWARYFKSAVDKYRKTGKDNILRNAPHLVITLSDKRNSTGPDSARFALTFIDIYAHSMKLGTCFAGFFMMAAAARHPEIIRLLNIPEEKMITGALMLGHPKHTYNKLPSRNVLDVKWI